MNPALRRLCVFLVLAGSGIGLLWLASDKGDVVSGPILGEANPSSDQVLGLVDPEQGTQTQLVLQDLTFERTREVEIEPGVFEQRPVSLVRLRNGRPGPDGSLLVDKPVITFLDERSGSQRGTLVADTGRFEAAGGLIGMGALDVTSLQAEAFALMGHVDGQFPLADGSHATLACEELRVDGETAHAPDLVTWTRDELTFTGVAMTWNGVTGLLEFARDAELSLPAADDRVGVTLTAVAGLEWHVPLDENGTGWGILRGPVEGQGSDGSHLAAQRLRLFSDASALQLDGDAEVGLLDANGGHSTLRADSLTLASDGARGMALAEALGDVTATLSGADGAPDTVLQLDGLRGDGDELVSTSPVVLTRGSLRLDGSGLRWRELDGRLEIPQDVTLTMSGAIDPRYLGARLESPRGIVLWLPQPGSGDDDPRGELRGPIEGSLPDGTLLRGDRLVWDGPGGVARLHDDVLLERPDEAGALRAEARLLELHIDPDGVSGALSLRGDVRAEARPGEGEVLRLTSERLDVESGRLRVPGTFVAEQGVFRLAGEGLDADQVSRQLLVGGPLQVDDLADPAAPPLLVSSGDLTWFLAAESDDPVDGHGRLEGPLQLRSADGWLVDAARLVADGRLPRAEFPGELVARGPGGELLRTADLVVHGPVGARQFDAPGTVEFSMAGLEGSGRGLHAEEATGRLVLRHDIVLEQQPLADATADATSDATAAATADDAEPGLGGALSLAASGPLEWFIPPGAEDAWRDGHGRLSGDVLVTHALGHELLTEELLVDGPGGTLELVGASHVTSPTVEGVARLSAAEGFLVTIDPSGALVGLHARGGVDGLTGDVLDGHALTSDELLVDRVARTITLLGSARLERRREGRVTSLSTGPTGRLQAVTDAQDQLVWVDAGGGVELQADDAHGTSETLTWNVAEDHVVFDGGVRFTAMGFGMGAPSVEFWPEQMRWFIPRSVSVIELGEADS